MLLIMVKVVLIGSSFMAPSHKNPFSYEVRSTWVKDVDPNINTIGISDFPHSDEELANEIIKTVVDEYPNIDINDMCLVGHLKDDSSYYLNIFPEFKFVDHYLDADLHSSDIRDLTYKHRLRYVKGVIPPIVLDFLESYIHTDDCKHMENERDYQVNYMLDYDQLNFPPIFVTGDAVVLYDKCILLIRRGNAHGYGQWALPGGYLDATETVDRCIIRELEEETSFDMLFANAKLVKTIVFDSPHRSVMARSITHAGLILVPTQEEFPVIAYGDDAIDAEWIPINSLINMRDKIFLDHYHIITKMLQIKAGLLL